MNAGQSNIEHLGVDKIKEACQGGFEVTTDFRRSGETDALIICVTPPHPNKNREPELSYVTGMVDSLFPH
jgi:UDP-N-acetyl-D-glucosamine dehydrogenase